MNKQSVFLGVSVFLLLTGLAWGFFFTLPAYDHPMPEEDCSKAYDYPMCERAVTPDVEPPAPASKVFLTVILIGIAGIILFFASLRASVMSQKDLVVRDGTETHTKSAAQAQKAFPTGRTPTTIPDNSIPDNAVVKRG